MHTLIGGRIRRTKPRRRVLDYLKGLLSPIQRKNGWQLACKLATPTPTGYSGCLLPTSGAPTWWGDDLQSYLVEHLGHP